MRRLWPGLAVAAALALALWVATVKAGRDFAWEKMSGSWIDEERLLKAHEDRKAEVGQTWEDAWWVDLEHMLWPDDDTLGDLSVDAELTARARAECVKELKWILKPEYLPKGLEDHLLAISGYGRNGSDFLLCRYSVDGRLIQIIYSGHATGLLIVPREPPPQPQASAEYALQVAKALFVAPRPQDEPRIKAAGIMVGGIAHGGITNPAVDHTVKSPVGPGPWYASTLITDGRYVFLWPAKWGLREGIDLRGRKRAPEAPPLDRPIRLFDPAD